MKSRANIKTHPLHPVLIAFPVAFFTGTLVFDILGGIQEKDSFHTTALYLLTAGIGMGIVAAIPGLIDYLYTVPPNSSAKKRATTHALINVCMLALFITALFYRIRADMPSLALVIGLEATGFILISVAGWMGGTLVHRNQIGIDPRYAFAGKWNEEYFTEHQGKVAVGNSDELKRDQMKLVHLSGKRIVVALTEEGHVAFDDRCTHKGGALAGGMMICGTVQCPWHGSQFDVHTGEVKAGPADEKINIYKVDVVNKIIYLHLNH